MCIPPYPGFTASYSFGNVGTPAWSQRGLSPLCHAIYTLYQVFVNIDWTLNLNHSRGWLVVPKLMTQIDSNQWCENIWKNKCKAAWAKNVNICNRQCIYWSICKSSCFFCCLWRMGSQSQIWIKMANSASQTIATVSGNYVSAGASCDNIPISNIWQECITLHTWMMVGSGQHFTTLCVEHHSKPKWASPMYSGGQNRRTTC